MDLATIAGIVIAAAGVLLAGMAGLIKAMVLGRLEEIKRDLTGMAREQSRHGERITRLEEWRKFTEAN